MTPVPSIAEIEIDIGKTVEPYIYEAELADQARRCRVDPYNDALAGALLRRVQRALAMRNLPLGVLQDDSGSTRLGSTDPEVRRLEAPYRKVTIG